jgi:hypothetical protein
MRPTITPFTSRTPSDPQEAMGARARGRIGSRLLGLVIGLFMIPGLSGSLAQPTAAAALGEVFARHTPGSAARVDHAVWDRLIKTFVRHGEDGVARVDYRRFKSEAHADLKSYVRALEAVDVAGLDRPEQFAFWANLYNAKTIDIVLDAYPVASIKDIRLGGGVVAAITGGPWKAKVTTVAGQKLSLDDIEHAILRPIFADSRVHYAVNCASIGCPDLGPEAFVGARLDAQLDAAARTFVNHPRGVRFDGKRLIVSSIYSWFQDDFGGSEQSVIAHLKTHARDDLVPKLANAQKIDDYAYDWSLNDVSPSR